MNYLKKKIDKLYKLIDNSEKIVNDLKYLQLGGALTTINPSQINFNICKEIASQIYKENEVLNKETIYNKIYSLPDLKISESNLSEFIKYIFTDTSDVNKDQFIDKCQIKYDNLIADNIVNKLTRGNNDELTKLENYLEQSKELIIKLSSTLDDNVVLINPKCSDSIGYECWNDIKKTLESIDLNVKNIKI